MFLNQLCKEQSRLQSLCKILETQIQSFPDGDLLCAKNGRQIKWYKSNGTAPIYISKKDSKLAQQLAMKKYYTAQSKEFSQQIQFLDCCIKSYQSQSPPSCSSSTSLLDPSSNYYPLIKSYFEQFPDELEQWLNTNYEHNTYHPENLIHKTLSGQFVRSKSEVIIANSLFHNKIPYRYECALHLDDLVLYPDFTICHPKTRNLFYWEHFGMMSNQDYRERTYSKLRLYGDHQIIPSINLITTYETQSHPINSEKVQQLIEEYFLT